MSSIKLLYFLDSTITAESFVLQYPATFHIDITNPVTDIVVHL
jgi:hypothetical protein